MRIAVDFGICESNGICMGLAPDVFDLGDDDQLTVQESHVGLENESTIREAARQCPRQAITVTD